MAKYKCFYIIPAFDEAKAIAETVIGLKNSAPPGEIVVVDDGSNDDIGPVALRQK